MRPKDIEKIANVVVGAFGRPIRASAGCAGISDPTSHSCDEGSPYDCSGDYACGGQGTFTCTPEDFDCGSFSCESNWDCIGEYD